MDYIMRGKERKKTTDPLIAGFEGFGRILTFLN